MAIYRVDGSIIVQEEEVNKVGVVAVHDGVRNLADVYGTWLHPELWDLNIYILVNL